MGPGTGGAGRVNRQGKGLEAGLGLVPQSNNGPSSCKLKREKNACLGPRAVLMLSHALFPL